jgi:hypothetical protein
MTDAIKIQKLRFTKYRMPKLQKISVILIAFSISSFCSGQSANKNLELSFGYSHTNNPKSLQKDIAKSYLTEELGSYDKSTRAVIPSGAIVFEINVLNDPLTSTNLSEELSLFYSLGIQLEKRLSFVAREEQLVDENQNDPEVTYRMYDRTTYRIFENLNAFKLGGGLAYTHHIDRTWNVGVKAMLALGRPISNNMVIGKEVRREVDAISEDGTHQDVLYQSLSTDKIKQDAFTLIEPQLRLGVDYKPFEERMVFINISYGSSAKIYRIKHQNITDYANGFSFAVRSKI